MRAALKLKPDSHQTKLALISAAKPVFSSKGFHGTNVSDIVAAVGMAQGSFYNHFKNKKAIFEEILQTFADRVVEAIESVDLKTVTDETSYYMVGMALGSTLSQIFLSERELARIFFWDAVGIDPEFDRILETTYRRVTEGTQAYVERGQEVGVVRSDISPKVTAAAMVGMCAHLTNRYLRNDFDGVEPAELLKTLVSVHLNGIMKRKE